MFPFTEITKNKVSFIQAYQFLVLTITDIINTATYTSNTKLILIKMHTNVLLYKSYRALKPRPPHLPTKKSKR